FNDPPPHDIYPLSLHDALPISLKGVPIAVEHLSWIYMENWLGLRRVVALEPKPGVPPSAGYLAQVVDTLQKDPVKMVIRAAYEEDRKSTRLNSSHLVISYAVFC